MILIINKFIYNTIMIYLKNCKHIIVFILLITFNNPSYAFEKNSYFIGHPYGYHGNKHVPDRSLKNFLIKNPPNFILLGGDMTENPNDFKLFYQYLKNFNFLAVRGNHDGDLFSKIPFWENKNINNKKIFNLDMNADMKFDKTILGKKNNTIVVQHYLWFLRLFTDIPNSSSTNNFKDKIISKIRYFFSLKIPLVNSMYGSTILEKKEIEKINFGNNNIYLAGDCGAYKDKFSYSKTFYKNNIFICSGIGSEWANHVVDLRSLEPIFFDINGNITKHSCKKIDGKLQNVIEFCLPYNINSKKLWTLLE